LTVGADIPQILALAKSRERTDREQLIVSLIGLCEQNQSSGEALAEPVERLMNSVFMMLAAEAERDVRQLLSERLADAPWAPRDLINHLARDEIEVARPVIAQSPVLLEADLVRLLALAALDHQIEVARRPGIGPRVVEAIINQAQPEVLTALADNDTADVSPLGMTRLVEASRNIAAMRSPLVRHPRLTPDLAEQLYVWVGQSLRAAIVGRFKVDVEALDGAIARAVQDAKSADGGALDEATDEARREMERRLVAKLFASQQLRPGYLMRALREQRLTLFCAALAQLAGVETALIERAIDMDRPELLALACAASGVDQGAFADLLEQLRELTGGKPMGGADAGRRAMRAFSTHDPGLAAAALRQALAAA